MNIRLSHNASGVIKVIHSDIYNYNVYDENTTKKFQSTPDFEFMWHRLIADSVIDQEEKEKYIRFSLRRRFYKYASFGGLEIDNKALMATDFYKELKHDIRLYKYHLSIRKSILFYSTNVHVRTFVVKTKTFITKIKEWFKKPKPAK